MSKKLASVLVRTLIGIAALAVVVIIAAVAIAFFSAQGTIDKDQGLFWLSGTIAVAAMVGAMVVSVAWMRSIDEAAREAHKAAWFWGGCGGMGVGGVFLILASLPQAETLDIPVWFEGRADPVAHAATGALGMMLLMVIGYILVWAWWWIARMRE